MNCSVCKSGLKPGDKLAVGSMMKPFCKQCERYAYPIYITKGGGSDEIN